MSDWVYLLPQAILCAGGLAALGLGAVLLRPAPGLQLGGALLFLAAAGAIVLALPAAGSVLDDMLAFDGIVRFYQLLILGSAGLSLLFASRYASLRGLAGDELYALVLFATLGMLLLAGAANWVIFVLGLELFTLCLYVLIALDRGRRTSLEAALKYFVPGAAAAGCLIFGVALIYAATGSLDLASSLASAVAGDVASFGPGLAGLALILLGVGFKLALAPFHLWAPDVYQGAPAPVTAFLATGSKVAVYAALLRLVSALPADAWQALAPVFWLLSAATLLAGSLPALTQTRVKRLLAYSSVAQMGYLLLALLAYPAAGPAPVMFYAAAYVLMDLGAFGSLGLLSPVSGDLDALEGFAGLGRTRPWPAAVLAVSLLSLAGLPLTMGFVGKFVVFVAVVRAGYPVLAGIGILGAVVAAGAYLRVLGALYFSRPVHAGQGQPPGPTAYVALGLVGALIVLLGIVPGPLLGLLR
jgi:NADH-quinone oxidoreductase subunit N